MSTKEEGKGKLMAALDIMQRMPPNRIDKSLDGLLALIPEETEELLQRVDQPLMGHTCPKTGHVYLLCDYNRDGDSFRSPWSNEYDPPIEDGLVPSDDLRKMEAEANKIFRLYTKQYYGPKANTSVYFWDLDGAGFASCWLIKKKAPMSGSTQLAEWDAIHVLQVVPKADGSGNDYQLTSTIMVHIGGKDDNVGNMDLSGSLVRQRKLSSASKNVIAQMGALIETQEGTMKSEIEKIYFGKMSYILGNLRSTGGGADTKLAGLAQEAEKAKKST